MIKAFLETAAPRGANVVLLLEIVMGIGLLLGARLARKGRFRQHAWCQSAIVLLNLAVVTVMMIPSFHVYVLPGVPAKLGKAYYALATTHGAFGAVTELAGLYIALRGHEHLAGNIANHQIQGVDANHPCALVGRAVTGNGDIHALVRAAFISEMKSRSPEKRRLSILAMMVGIKLWEFGLHSWSP